MSTRSQPFSGRGTLSRNGVAKLNSLLDRSEIHAGNSTSPATRTPAGTVMQYRRRHYREEATAGAIDFSLFRHGYTISGNTITLLSGKIKMHGLKEMTTPQATFTLGGTQYFYVHHVRNSTACAWASAGAEPGSTSTTDFDLFFYKFVGTTLQAGGVGHTGDYNGDTPI